MNGVVTVNVVSPEAVGSGFAVISPSLGRTIEATSATTITGARTMLSDPARHGTRAAAGSGSSSSTIWMSLTAVTYNLRPGRVPEPRSGPNGAALAY